MHSVPRSNPMLEAGVSLLYRTVNCQMPRPLPVWVGRELHPLFGCTSILDWRVREPLWHLRASIGQTLLAFYGTRRVRLSLSDPFSIELVNICGRIRKKGPYCAKYDFLLFLSCHNSKAIRAPGFPLGL